MHGCSTRSVTGLACATTRGSAQFKIREPVHQRGSVAVMATQRDTLALLATPCRGPRL